MLVSENKTEFITFHVLHLMSSNLTNFDKWHYICFVMSLYSGPGAYLCSRVLCSPGPMFPGSYVPQVPCSPGPMFPGSYVPRVLCSPGPMFPGSHVPRVLCWGGGWVHSRKYCHRCWHIVAYIVTHMNVDISWRMNMLTPIGISIGVPKLPNAIIWYQIP